MSLEPTDDPTPIRTTIPDHDWFPCPHCGRAVRCPPVAKPVARETTALIPRRPPTVVAEELLPPGKPCDATVIQRRDPV